MNDTKESVDFYVQQLGFEPVFNAGEFATIKQVDLTIWVGSSKTSAVRLKSDGSVPEPGGQNRFVYEVEDIEATVASMKEAGIKFRYVIISGIGGKQIVEEAPPETRLKRSSLPNTQPHRLDDTEKP